MKLTESPQLRPETSFEIFNFKDLSTWHAEFIFRSQFVIKANEVTFCQATRRNAPRVACVISFKSRARHQGNASSGRPIRATRKRYEVIKLLLLNTGSAYMSRKFLLMSNEMFNGEITKSYLSSHILLSAVDDKRFPLDITKGDLMFFHSLFRM